MPKVLISDKLSADAVEIFRQRGLEVDFEPDLGKDPDALAAAIGLYDGLAIRSATKVTPEILAKAERLKVIGRAGIGVDNVDLAAASARGVVVMNTPYGNAVTTAEHALALLFAVARRIPAADASTRAGKWEKSKFTGAEITGKTLGVIGCGNIGAIVAARAIGLKMKVIAYDPFLSSERGKELGVEKIEDIDALLARADFVTLHLPRTEQTANILNAARIAKMKPGARLVNCARGGLVDEAAVAEAVREGRLAGAAFDVYAEEPARAHPFFEIENIVVTPHLGASTVEAQEKVALQVAEQMCDYLLTGAVTNAVNAPSVSAEEAPILAPWIKAAEVLGGFAGQLTEDPITAIEIEYLGTVADYNLRPLTAATLAAVLKPNLGESVNMVSAPLLAKERGVAVSETRKDSAGSREAFMRVTVSTESMTRSVAGAVYSDGRPRIIEVKGVPLEAEPHAHMLYTTNIDQPGFVGALGMALGEEGVNIATFALGRPEPGGEAITLIGLDAPVTEAQLAKLRKLPLVRRAEQVSFAL